MDENEIIEEVAEETPEIEEYAPSFLVSVILDENGYIQRSGVNCLLENETLHFEVGEIPDDLFEHTKAYKVVDNTLVLDTSKIAEVEDEKELAELRQRREEECFSVINRSALWYVRLTEEQKAALDVWYQKWLDVTETREVPTPPSWL